MDEIIARIVEEGQAPTENTWEKYSLLLLNEKFEEALAEAKSVAQKTNLKFPPGVDRDWYIDNVVRNNLQQIQHARKLAHGEPPNARSDQRNNHTQDTTE